MALEEVYVSDLRCAKKIYSKYMEFENGEAIECYKRLKKMTSSHPDLDPDSIKAIMQNKPVEIRNPDSTRPWQHVLEPLAGYLLLGIKLLKSPRQFSEGWNFGPFTNQAIAVRQVIETIIKHAGKGDWQNLSKQEKQHEANLLQLDISKAIQKLKWQPFLSFNRAIEMTVDWYMMAKDSNALSFTRNQIQDYQKLWK